MGNTRDLANQAATHSAAALKLMNAVQSLDSLFVDGDIYATELTTAISTDVRQVLMDLIGIVDVWCMNDGSPAAVALDRCRLHLSRAHDDLLEAVS